GHFDRARPGRSMICRALHLDVEAGKVLARAVGEVEDIDESPAWEHGDLIPDRACEAGPGVDRPGRLPGEAAVGSAGEQRVAAEGKRVLRIDAFSLARFSQPVPHRVDVGRV